jgi:anti-repressor protein
VSGDSDVHKFSHDLFGEIRAIRRDEELWFVGSEIAKILGYADTAQAIRKNCKGGVHQTLPSISGEQVYTIIPESDLYRLVLRSKLPSAEQFQDWVVGEVLPTLRKTGRYEMPAPVAEASMAEMTLKVVLHLKGEVDRLAPKAAFADEICGHDKLFLVEDVAKVLGMTARKLNKFLHSRGVIFNRGDGWKPYAKYDGSGLFVIVTRTGDKSDGSGMWQSQQLKITCKGREFIHRLWREDNNLPGVEN